MSDSLNMQPRFDEAEAFRVAGHPADAVLAYDDVLNMDPLDAEALHMRGVAFGMRMSRGDRRTLVTAGHEGDPSLLMMADLVAARQRYIHEENLRGEAHATRDIGKAHYLATDFEHSENEINASIRQFEALDMPAEAAMSRNYLGRLSLLGWTYFVAPPDSIHGGIVLGKTETHFRLADEVLRTLGHEKYELYGKTPYAMVLAILGKKDESRAQLERAKVLNESHGNATHAAGIRAVAIFNRLETVVPDIVSRSATRKLIAH